MIQTVLASAPSLTRLLISIHMCRLNFVQIVRKVFSIPLRCKIYEQGNCTPGKCEPPTITLHTTQRTGRRLQLYNLQRKINSDKRTTMTMSDVNSVCERIHSLVQMSGLHFNINQTPWSSYITIRRKFVSPGSYDVKTMCTETVVMEQLKEKIKQLEHKLAGAEFQVEELQEKFANKQENHEKTINLLNSKIDTLEKDKKLKEEIIQNTNTHFNTKSLKCPKKKGLRQRKKH